MNGSIGQFIISLLTRILHGINNILFKLNKIMVFIMETKETKKD